MQKISFALCDLFPWVLIIHGANGQNEWVVEAEVQ